FAYSLRELLRHIFGHYAPDDNILNCSWYKNETDKENGVTRKQRMMYMIHGGILSDFFSEGMQEDLKDKMGAMVKAIDKLSKYTHIEPKTFNSQEGDVSVMVTETLDIVIDVLQLTDECRSEVRESVHGELYKCVDDVLSVNVFDALDDKSTHTSVDGYDLEYFTITDIDEAFITIQGEGTVYCTLQYGSGSDLRNDMGAVMEHSFPMTFECKSPTVKPYEIELHPTNIDIDDSGWYE